MFSNKGILTIAALALLAFVCHAAIGADSDDDRTTTHAITVNAASLPDFDGDGTVGFSDFVIFAGVFGARQGDEKYDARYDLNDDGEIGFSDFVIFAQNFGKEVPSPVVAIPDANLRAAIEAALDKAAGTPITQAEMATMDSLTATKKGISDLTGLESATNLQNLNLSFNNITDISPLAGLTKLRGLHLWDNNITDISPLAGLTKLRNLELGFNDITDISPLEGLTNLTFLGLFYNYFPDISALAGLTNLQNLTLGSDYVPLTDISPLAGLTNLTFLWLARNDITDISPLAGLTNLTFLHLWGNIITDISVLAGLTNLEELHLGNNDITDISTLAGLTSLKRLELDANEITDPSTLASVLSGLTNLTILNLSALNITDISLPVSFTNLTVLNLGSNNITDISVLSGLINLEELVLSDNDITDISVMAGLTDLKFLQVNRNNLTDVSALTALARLSHLNLRFNGITDISALAGLTDLIGLDLRGNPLSDTSIAEHVSDLEDRGVTVLFDSFLKGNFDIELVFDDSFTGSQKRVLQYIARRWMAVIAEDVPDYELAEGWSGTCGDELFEIPAGEKIDDLRILVTSFDRGVAGWGGPSLLREESHLPVLGCMAFSQHGINLLVTGLHEIGHVLGFGTIWEDLGFVQDLDGDTHFNGPLAIAAFDDAGGWDYTGKKVPVKTGDGGHWRVPVLGHELMGPGGGGSLSAITVQSFADLGYGVDVTQADPYTLPGATTAKASAKIAAALPSIPGDDRLRGRLESAEQVWGRALDLRDDPQKWLAGPPTQSEPKLKCGVELRREPIYVVDPQGRIIRTIGQ